MKFLVVMYEPNDSQVAKDACNESTGIATILGIAGGPEAAEDLCLEDAQNLAVDSGYNTDEEWLAAEGTPFPIRSDFVTGFEWAGRRYRIEEHNLHQITDIAFSIGR